MGDSSKRIMIVTGEASGDLHGAKLMNAITAQLPDTQPAHGPILTCIMGVHRTDPHNGLHECCLDLDSPTWRQIVVGRAGPVSGCCLAALVDGASGADRGGAAP